MHVKDAVADDSFCWTEIDLFKDHRKAKYKKALTKDYKSCFAGCKIF